MRYFLSVKIFGIKAEAKLKIWSEIIILVDSLKSSKTFFLLDLSPFRYTISIEKL